MNEDSKKVQELNEDNSKVSEINDNFNYELDFATSSAISRVNIKFLALYIPIFWFSGILVAVCWAGFILHSNWIIIMLTFPIAIFFSYIVFIFGCALFSKLFLILINLIHKPKEGVFRAEKRNNDFEFWCLRTELKKLIVWLMNNCPLPWIDTWAFRWFGSKLDFTSHLYDAWVDVEFIIFGRKVTIGQGAVVMTSMVVGKYLIIKKIIFNDYSVIGGVSTISPGTIIGKDTVIGALSSTNYNQILEPGWIYFGLPGIKLKPNKYAESKRDVILRKDIEKQEKYAINAEVNIDEDKKDLI